MGLSKSEINLRRLLAAAPQQQNQAKLIHYVATLREQLEQQAAERTSEGLPRISKATLNDYSESIEAIAAKLAGPVMQSNAQVPQVLVSKVSVGERPYKTEEESTPSSPGLSRRFVPSSSGADRARDTAETNPSGPVKLDAAAQAHITKHRKLQEGLTDEMVVLARQLKESSLLMSQSVTSTKKILDSTEKAVEHGLASTGHANVQAMFVYSQSFKTSCFTWLMIFAMTCIFIMVVLLIRVT